MHITPDLNSFLSQHKRGETPLAYVTLPADLETPVSAMLKLMGLSPYHFLFESVQDGARRDRYSIIGFMPDLIYRCTGDRAQINRNPIDFPEKFTPCDREPLAALQGLIDESSLTIPEHLPPMASGLFGYLSYDMVRLMEKLPDQNPDPIGIPTSLFIRPQIIVVFDSVKDTMTVITPIRLNRNEVPEHAYERALARIAPVLSRLSSPLDPRDYRKSPAPVKDLTFNSNMTPQSFHQMVKKAKEYILAGDIFQVVPSQRFTGDFHLPPFALYRSLRHLNPSPYLFYMGMENFALVGSSPEILLKKQDNIIILRPLAGTRKRGADKAEDEALTKDLLDDPKERSEHLMLLDLGRNDIGRIAEVGSVNVKEQFGVEYYSHVMHIVSHVEGKLKKGCTAIDALKASFPVGTVSGAPKIRAMEIIDELEPEKRSFYAGGVGYFGAGGAVDICITLRTGLVKDGKFYVQSGAGVVADSDPEKEFEETVNKAKALMRAAEGAARFV
ncbi:MAG: anthranilate synthase component [Rickettsiales bacterium]|jgi:anthranilate synthase component 1|nr:anthranilate synthase component [Rickettsiales bacterium]